MTAATVHAVHRQDMAARLAEGYRVGDVMAEFAAERREVMDAGFAYQLRYVETRDAFDITERTHRAVVPDGHAVLHPRHSPLIRPVVVEETPVPEPTGGQEAAARRIAAVEALRDRIASLDIEPKALRTWAHVRGIDCPRTGMLPARIVDAYEEWIAAGRPAPAMPEPPGPPPRPVLESTTWEELGDAETVAVGPVEVEEPEPVEDDQPEEAPATTRLFALPEGCPLPLAAAVLAAAVEHVPAATLAVADGWLYLEQAAS